MRRCTRCVASAAVIALACLTMEARAEEGAAPQWQFSITPHLWVAGISGTLETKNPRVPAQDVSVSGGSVWLTQVIGSMAGA